MTTVTRYPLVDGRACLDPQPLREDLARYGGGFVNFDGLANSIECPRGRAAGNAWFLMGRANADAVPKNAAVNLAWQAETTETFANYWLVKAIAVTPGLGTDQAYLVHFKDVRAVLEMSSVNKRYNYEKPLPFALADARLAEKFYSDSLNAGALWTWATAFANLWTLLPGAAGAAPTLPFTPASSPRNLAFTGDSAWGAVCEFLARIGCEIGFNPRTGAITVIDMANYNDGTVNGLSDNRAFDAFPLAGINAANEPANFQIQFPKITPTNMADDPPKTYDVASGASGAASGTKSPVWDSMPARYCPNQTLNNDATLNSRATELGGYLAGWYGNATYDRLIVYNGIRRVQPTSRVARIVWRDYGDGAGAMTEIYNGGSMPPIMPPEASEPPKLCRFELTAALTAGGSAAAKALEWVASTSLWTIGACALTVYDSIGSVTTTLPIGTKGFAAWNDDSEKWEMVGGAAGGGSTLTRCKVYDDQIATDSTGSVQPWDQATTAFLTGAGMITISTQDCQQLFKNQIIWIERNTDEGTWQVVEIEYRVIKGKAVGNISKGGPGTIHRYDSADAEIALDINVISKCHAIKTGGWVFAAWSEGAWVIVESEAACEATITVVTSISFDSATCTFTFCTRDLCLPEGSTVSAEDCGVPAAEFVVQFPRIGGPDAPIVEL